MGNTYLRGKKNCAWIQKLFAPKQIYHLISFSHGLSEVPIQRQKALRIFDSHFGFCSGFGHHLPGCAVSVTGMPLVVTFLHGSPSLILITGCPGVLTRLTPLAGWEGNIPSLTNNKLPCSTSPATLPVPWLQHKVNANLIPDDFQCECIVEILKRKGWEVKCMMVLFPNLAQPPPEELCHLNQNQLSKSIYINPSKNLLWQPKRREHACRPAT